MCKRLQLLWIARQFFMYPFCFYFPRTWRLFHCMETCKSPHMRTSATAPTLTHPNGLAVSPVPQVHNLTFSSTWRPSVMTTCSTSVSWLATVMKPPPPPGRCQGMMQRIESWQSWHCGACNCCQLGPSRSWNWSVSCCVSVRKITVFGILSVWTQQVMELVYWRKILILIGSSKSCNWTVDSVNEQWHNIFKD